MPIYEYKCEKCDLVFEELVSASSSENTTCPECGAENTEKVLSTFCGRTSSGSTDIPPMPAGGCGGAGFS